jgi:hypothetical protein
VPKVSFGACEAGTFSALANLEHNLEFNWHTIQPSISTPRGIGLASCSLLFVEIRLNEELMEQLQSVLAQEDTLLFLGSGISMWSGLPTWSGLIEELAQFVQKAGADPSLIRAEACRGDLLQAASYGFDKLTRLQIGRFMQLACRYGVAKPHEIHHKLVSLGPRCFITTNYDNLIEEALRIWQPGRFYRPPITNRHLTELSEVVHARAIDFVFKPHGDAADAESIILTREQYRELLPDGEKHATLDSVKTLLLSRPVVYFGFGLRDPDFIYIRDLLSNTYRGGVRDHYAVMADISDSEVDYWRRNYGIHLVCYKTTVKSDGTRDHAPILDFLDDLQRRNVACIHTHLSGGVSSFQPDKVLALARHAARLAQTPKSDPEYSIYVRPEEKATGGRTARLSVNRISSWPVLRFLEEGPVRAVLTGLPGAGKSYSFRRAASDMANDLNRQCLSDLFDEKTIVVPILADLKLYRGDVTDLIRKTLPVGLTLEDLSQQGRIKIFLDSFNEMPHEYLENGSYAGDFSKFLAKYNSVSLVIGSRTSDGISKLGFPVYCLDSIDGKFVTEELQRIGVEVKGRFQDEVFRLLQKPFNFRLVASKTVQLPEIAHPRDFYKLYFRNLTEAFQKRFDKNFDVEYPLSLTAYEAINSGEEALPLETLLEVLKSHLKLQGIVGITERDIANWLVSKAVIFPYQGARIAFFHQSVTEYLAASELARRFHNDKSVLKTALSLTRWDQALFLALSLLPPSEAQDFLEKAVEQDFCLALNASKYLETGREEIVSKLLENVPSRILQLGPHDNKLEYAISCGISISDSNEPQLRSIMQCRNSIGGAAVSRLVELKGEAIKEELIQSMVDARDDYNFCANGVAPAIKHLITSDDLPLILTLVNALENKVPSDADEHVAHGFIAGIAKLMPCFDMKIIFKSFLPASKEESLAEIKARILCSYLQGQHSTEALNFAMELLCRGVRKAATTIYFILNFANKEDNIMLDAVSVDHVERLLAQLSQEDNDCWSIRALKCICEREPLMAEFVMERSKASAGVLRSALLYCANPKNQKPVFGALHELGRLSPERRSQEPIYLLGHIELDWVGQEDLFVQLLQIHDIRLAEALLDQVYISDGKIRECDFRPVERWLIWLSELQRTKKNYWIGYKLSWLLGNASTEVSRLEFITEFNKEESKFRKLLASSILSYFPELTTDDFTEGSISYLLASLKHDRTQYPLNGHLLGRTATERFVSERLLPLLSSADSQLSSTLHDVLKEAGQRFGRRYVCS